MRRSSKRRTRLKTYIVKHRVLGTFKVKAMSKKDIIDELTVKGRRGLISIRKSRGVK